MFFSETKANRLVAAEVHRGRDLDLLIIGTEPKLTVGIPSPAFDGPVVQYRARVLTARHHLYAPRDPRERREDRVQKKPKGRRIQHRLPESTATSGTMRRVRSLPGPHGSADWSPRVQFASMDCPTCACARRYARRKPLSFFLRTAPTNHEAHLASLS